MKAIARGIFDGKDISIDVLSEEVEKYGEYVKALIEFSHYDELFFKLLYANVSWREIEFLEESPYKDLREYLVSRYTRPFIGIPLEYPNYPDAREWIELYIRNIEDLFTRLPTLVFYPARYYYKKPERIDEIIDEYESLAYYCPLYTPYQEASRCSTIYIEHQGIEIIGKLLEMDILPIPVYESLPEKIYYIYKPLLKNVSPILYIGGDEIRRKRDDPKFISSLIRELEKKEFILMIDRNIIGSRRYEELLRRL